MSRKKSRVQDLLFEHNDPRHVLADAFAEVEKHDIRVKDIVVCKGLHNLYRKMAHGFDPATSKSGDFKVWGVLMRVKRNIHPPHIEMKADNGEAFTYCINARTSQVCGICAVAEVMET